MYTQCPDCHTAFRVTALVLQKAGGRVRCGGCGNAFSAIDYLSEQLPTPVGERATDNEASGTDTATAATSGKSGSPPDEEYTSKSEALLKTLNELAGDDNVRIEDTGLEWRVLEDVTEEEILIDDSGAVESLDDARIEAGQTEDGGEQQFLDLHQAPRNERRYDDNTPLPDDFEDEEDEPYLPPVPKRRSEDHDASTDFDSHQIDLAMGKEADDWADLLDDEDGIASQAAQTASTSATEIPFEVEEELAAIHSELLENAATLRAQPAEHHSAAAEDAALAGQTEIHVESASNDKLEIADETEEARPSHDAATIEALELEDSAILEELEDSAYLDSLEEKERPEDQEPEDQPEEAEELEESEESEGFEAQQEQSAAPDEPEPVDLRQDQFDDYEEDELTADQEADIVGKLRESTGAFQKQIEAAQQALNQGDIDFYSDDNERPGEDAEDEDAIARQDSALSDEKADADAEEVAFDSETEADGDIRDESTPEPELLVDVDDVEAQCADDLLDEPAAAEDDAGLSHEDRLAQTMRMAGIDPADLEGDNVETIIMEGTNVRDALERERHTDDQEAISKLEDPGFLADTYMMNKGKMGGRRSTDPAGIGVILGVVIMALLLAAQWVHNSRDSLATYGFFKQTIGPVYRAVGKPVTPEWDIKGWRFLNTRGSADEDSQLLTIFSTVTNASEQALPYPLVHVSLTDRYEEIIGSKVLEPGEYLAGDLDPSRPVVPGDQFGAVIAIESPSAEAVGFKLNVCYRVTAGRVRCATEDFKD